MTTINETPQEKFKRLMAEHASECDESTRSGIPFTLDRARFDETLEAFKTTCSPVRETFPQPFPLEAL